MTKLTPFLVCAAIALFLVSGCGSMLQSLKNNPDCTTTIEGTLRSKQVWKGEGPFILMWQLGKIEVWKGTIVELRPDGVVFDRERVGMLVNPGPKFYAFDEITALCDQDGNLIHGRIPETLAPLWSLELMLKPEGGPASKRISLKMTPDQQFAYCIDPGRYVIEDITFTGKGNYKDHGVDFPAIVLDVRANAANYIGDVNIDYPPFENAKTIEIPYQIVSRPDRKDVNGLFIGEEKAQSDGIAGTHILQTVFRDDFKYRGSGYYNRTAMEVLP
jgi:hypothetical protein